MDGQMIITMVGSLGFPILEKILTKLDIHEGVEDDGR